MVDDWRWSESYDDQARLPLVVLFRDYRLLKPLIVSWHWSSTADKPTAVCWQSNFLVCVLNETTIFFLSSFLPFFLSSFLPFFLSCTIISARSSVEIETSIRALAVRPSWLFSPTPLRVLLDDDRLVTRALAQHTAASADISHAFTFLLLLLSFFFCKPSRPTDDDDAKLYSLGWVRTTATSQQEANRALTGCLTC